MAMSQDRQRKILLIFGARMSKIALQKMRSAFSGVELSDLATLVEDDNLSKRLNNSPTLAVILF